MITPLANFFLIGGANCNLIGARHGGSVVGPGTGPIVGARGRSPSFFPKLCPYRCKESNKKNRFSTKLISVRRDKVDLHWAG